MGVDEAVEEDTAAGMQMGKQTIFFPSLIPHHTRGSWRKDVSYDTISKVALTF